MDLLDIKNPEDVQLYLRQRIGAEEIKRITKLACDICCDWNNFDKSENEIFELIDRESANISTTLDAAKMCENTKSSLYTCTECIIMRRQHDKAFPAVCSKFAREDTLLHAKCLKLHRENVTAQDFGAPEKYSIPLNIPMVELANIDSLQTPLEKLHCLYSTYDYIFAELKLSIAETCSKSEQNVGNTMHIPTIDNCVIIPILVAVIVKSKLMHLYSNFYYITRFVGNLSDCKIMREIIQHFQKAIEHIGNVSDNYSTPPSRRRVFRDIDLCELIKLTAEKNQASRENEINLIDYQEERFTNLIVQSTTQHL